MLGVYVPEEMEIEPPPSPKPPDDSRTLEHRPEPEPEPEPEQPKPTNGKAKQTPEEWLEKIEPEFRLAGEAGSDALHALINRKDVQYGLEHLRGENRRRLNQALYDAEMAANKAKATEPTDDEFPGDTIAREEAASKGENFAEADGWTK
jgi:hypothetical protein